MSSNSAKRVRLHFKCKNLADLDTFSKSDPYVVLYSNTVSANVRPTSAGAHSNPNPNANGPTSAFGREIGRTEIIMNNLNPSFTKSIEAQFIFESRQDFTAVVFDDDGHKDDMKNDICGSAKFQLSHIICSANGVKEYQLTMPDGRTKGSIEISFTDVNTSSSLSSVRIGFRGANMKGGGWFGGPSYYYMLNRIQPNGTKKALYQSEAVSSTAPRWSVSPKLQVSELFGSTEDEPCLELEIFSAGMCWTSTIGSVQKWSFAAIKAAHASGLSAQPTRHGHTNNSHGEIFVTSIELEQFPTFTQSLASGWQINMALSIDFTGSNGDPKAPHSLHYMNPSQPNQYISAMMSVGDILMEYDTDKQIPVFGFGASIRGTTMHFFNVNMQTDPYVAGIQGALNVYGAFLPTAILSGPTNFAPTILSVTAGARQTEAQRVYTVLLIITDGEITDMRQTIDALVAADDAPLSIVIVGVGSGCDFQAMDELDGDGVQLRASNGRISRRDLVQFVPYRDFAPPKPREALAAEVLREIPDQFEEYLSLVAQRTGAQQRMNAAVPQRI